MRFGRPPGAHMRNGRPWLPRQPTRAPSRGANTPPPPPPPPPATGSVRSGVTASTDGPPRSSPRHARGWPAASRRGRPVGRAADRRCCRMRECPPADSVTVVRLLARRGDEVLMLRRAPGDSLGGCLEFPGGKVDRLDDGRFERPIVALRRSCARKPGSSSPAGHALSPWLSGSARKASRSASCCMRRSSPTATCACPTSTTSGCGIASAARSTARSPTASPTRSPPSPAPHTDAALSHQRARLAAPAHWTRRSSTGGCFADRSNGVPDREKGPTREAQRADRQLFTIRSIKVTDPPTGRPSAAHFYGPAGARTGIPPGSTSAPSVPGVRPPRCALSSPDDRGPPFRLRTSR